MSYDLVVSGRVVLPTGILEQGWVAAKGETIAAIGEGPAPAARQHHDAGDAWVLPGLVDGQTHAGSAKGFPGLEPTTRSAAAGGITTIVDMPYDDPNPINTVDLLRAKADAVSQYGYIDVAIYGTVGKGQGTDQVKPLIDAGACAFKISSFESHPTRFPRIAKPDIMDLLRAVADTDIPVGLHNEDQELVEANIARMKAAGRFTAEAHHWSRPPEAELLATVEFLEMGALTGAHVHIVHVSVDRGYELVTQYRNAGHRATAELCVHYLAFQAEDMIRLGNLLKVSPPIRPGTERLKLWDRLDKGEIAFVSSDHSSWPVTRKQTNSVFDAGAGIPGLETLVPGFQTIACRDHGKDIRFVVDYLAEGPARFFGLWPRKGGLTIGADADITIYQPGETKFDETKTHDGLNWSPFHGASFSGRVAATFLRGKMIYDGQSILGKPGDGRYVPRRQH